MSGIDPNPRFYHATDDNLYSDPELMMGTTASYIAPAAPNLVFIEFFRASWISSWLRLERNENGSLGGCYMADEEEFTQDIRTQVWGDLANDVARRLEWLM